MGEYNLCLLRHFNPFSELPNLKKRAREREREKKEKQAIKSQPCPLV